MDVQAYSQSMAHPLEHEQLARRVIRLMVADCQAEEIAKTLKVPLPQIKILVQSPMFQAMVKVERQRLKERLAENIPERFEAHASEAVDAYVHALRESDDWPTKLRAADAILDRGKYPKRTQVDAQHTVTIQLSASEKHAIEVACEEAGLALPAPAEPVKIAGVKHIDDVLKEEE